MGNWKLYKGGAAEYDRLAEAVTLDRQAALEATSWGLFQVLGINFAILGFHDVEAMVCAMADSEAAQLEAFVQFCTKNHLIQALRDLNWTSFARYYNGPAYAENRYDEKMATAFLAACGRPVDGLMRLGSNGADVKALQAALHDCGYPLTPDGAFGKVTELALRRFQSMNGLAADGVAGPATLEALGVALR